MIVKINDFVEIEKEIDVNFPIYRKVDLSQRPDFTMIKYCRLTEDLRSVSIVIIKENNQIINIEYSTSSNYSFQDGSGVDYHLGLGEYSSNKEEFEKASSEALNFIIDKLKLTN